jgi:hypothetical protein
MKTLCRCVAPFALLISFLPVSVLYAQADQQVQHVKRYISGQKTLVTYREGGPIYGTYFFLEVHFCASGRYVSFGQSRKQTVLGNEQVNNWRDNGRWDVLPFRGQVGLVYFSTSGKRDFVPMHIQPNGRISTVGGASILLQGRAQCR